MIRWTVGSSTSERDVNLALDGKVVLVTGGAKGIGAAIVRASSGEGATVAFVDRDQAAGEELQAALRASGARTEFLFGDVVTPDTCRHTVEHVVRLFGRLDALVNNVGVNDRIGLEHGTPARFAASLGLNLVQCYAMAHYALDALKKGPGSIVNISSKTAATGQGGTSGYVAAKAAILGLTREWAVELLPFGIRVNAVVPGEVWTPLYQKWIESFPDGDAKRVDIAKKIPLRNRFTEPDEIADMVVFLSSERASHITGQHIFVDGGYTHLDRAVT